MRCARLRWRWREKKPSLLRFCAVTKLFEKRRLDAANPATKLPEFAHHGALGDLYTAVWRGLWHAGHVQGHSSLFF